MVAAERRLDAHQGAYAMARKMSRYPTEGGLTKELDDWWHKHCMFLSDECRTVFTTAFSDLSDLRLELRLADESRDRNEEVPIEQARRINKLSLGLSDAPKQILDGIRLPAMNADPFIEIAEASKDEG